MSRDIGDGWRLATGLVVAGAGAVEVEFAYEPVVDEHGDVVAVDEDIGSLLGVFAADADEPALDADGAVRSDGDAAASWASRDRAGRGGGSGCGAPSFPGGDPADPAVGAVTVVLVAELVELGLQLRHGSGLPSIEQVAHRHHQRACRCDPRRVPGCHLSGCEGAGGSVSRGGRVHAARVSVYARWLLAIIRTSVRASQARSVTYRDFLRDLIGAIGCGQGQPKAGAATRTTVPVASGHSNTRRSPRPSASHCSRARDRPSVTAVVSPRCQIARCSAASHSDPASSSRCAAITARPGLVRLRPVLLNVAPRATSPQKPCSYPGRGLDHVPREIVRDRRAGGHDRAGHHGALAPRAFPRAQPVLLARLEEFDAHAGNARTGRRAFMRSFWLGLGSSRAAIGMGAQPQDLVVRAGLRGSARGGRS